ncbi:MAG: hypothetical protein DRQ55_09000 [Planctomycetota bacterium]|nr:MAG: hypothetical protein DRQ55_09000 [Planctomycetota bacterium]
MRLADDPVLSAARQGFGRAARESFRSVLNEALGASAALVRVMGPLAPSGSLWCADAESTA